MLEEHVCNTCKWTKADYDKYYAENPQELEDEEFLRLEFEDMVANGRNPTTFSDFFPEDYRSLTDMEKIDLLLDTACGCEFYFEEIGDESQAN
jgi:hypothetical protein